MLENYEYLEFDMRQPESVSIKVLGPSITGRILHGETPLDVVSAYTTYAGRMQPLPECTQKGAIVRAYGGEEAVMARVEQLEQAGVPLAGLWIEDWMGRRQNFTGTRLWWNWQLDRSIYPDWEGMVARLRERGIRVFSYFNPYLADSRRNRRHERNLFREARDAGYLVRKTNGNVYFFGAGGFDGALVDLTNPEARSWLKAIMREHLDTGVSGWMADFGEALPVDAMLYDGSDAATYHNQFPAEWARLNREVFLEAGLDEDSVFWTRSGNAKTPTYTRLTWLGDQTVTWDEMDGMKTVVNGLLSASLSGYSLIHADIGGYLSVTYPFFGIRRSKELLFRWVELGALQSIFRTHDSIRPEANPQVYSDRESLQHFAKFAALFDALSSYRSVLMEQASNLGYPMVRHPMLHYPDDPAVHEAPRQLMLGAEFMFAPVLDPGVDRLAVYLPAGEWVHLWTGEPVGSPEAGVWLDVDAPVGSPPIFYRADSVHGPAVRAQLAEGGWL